jgi:hypothetical protein
MLHRYPCDWGSTELHLRLLVLEDDSSCLPGSDIIFTYVQPQSEVFFNSHRCFSSWHIWRLSCSLLMVTWCKTDGTQLVELHFADFTIRKLYVFVVGSTKPWGLDFTSLCCRRTGWVELALKEFSPQVALEIIIFGIFCEGIFRCCGALRASCFLDRCLAVSFLGLLCCYGSCLPPQQVTLPKTC